MNANAREYQQIIFTFEANEDTSDVKSLAAGAFGTLIVPTSLVGRTLNLLTDVQPNVKEELDAIAAAALNNKPLLATAKTLVDGSNPFTASELTQVGAAGHVKLKLNTAPVAKTQVALWWKS